ncbi:Protein of unknown function, partial [Gryllus bimaculatus]
GGRASAPSGVRRNGCPLRAVPRHATPLRAAPHCLRHLRSCVHAPRPRAWPARSSPRARVCVCVFVVLCGPAHAVESPTLRRSVVVNRVPDFCLRGRKRRVFVCGDRHRRSRL